MVRESGVTGLGPSALVGVTDGGLRAAVALSVRWVVTAVESEGRLDGC